jgi:hypothetical protein
MAKIIWVSYGISYQSKYLRRHRSLFSVDRDLTQKMSDVCVTRKYNHETRDVCLLCLLVIVKRKITDW